MNKIPEEKKKNRGGLTMWGKRNSLDRTQREEEGTGLKPSHLTIMLKHNPPHSPIGFQTSRN